LHIVWELCFERLELGLAEKARGIALAKRFVPPNGTVKGGA